MKLNAFSDSVAFDQLKNFWIVSVFPGITFFKQKKTNKQ